MKNIINQIIIASLILFISISAYAQNKKVSVPLSFDNYYTYEMVIEALKVINKAYPELTKLELVGKSDEGREIFCLVINNSKTGKESDKPAIYVDGNIHGNEIQAGEVCLYLINYLLTNYGNNEEITKLIDKKCFYVIPVVNVDGRYHFFNDPNNSSSDRTMRLPKDDDNDGLVDEDRADDLDGDGNICQMRKKDPFGQYKTDPEDNRLMIRVKQGEKGEWTMLGSEGIDNDGDGKINEDEDGYVDGNRNWPFDWQPPYIQSGSGSYPFESVGLKAIGDFIRKRTNICMVWAFHNNGGMILRGPSTKAQGEYSLQDIQVYDYLGQQAERIIPDYRYMISWKDLYTTYGDFTEWSCMINGTFGFVGELFVTSTETFKTRNEEKKTTDKENTSEDRQSSQRERLKFNDHLAQGELYKPWKTFKHPIYGDIEIGGWTKMSSRLPTPFMLKDLIHRNASAVIFSAKNAPDISMEVLETKNIGKSLNRIRVRLINSAAIPSMSAHAQRVRLYPQDILSASGNNIIVITAGKINDIFTDQVEYKEFRPEIQFLTVPGFGKVEYEFLLSGNGKVKIKYESRHAGKIEKTIDIE